MELQPFSDLAPGEYYRHFKGKIYKVIAIAKHSETKEEMIVYENGKDVQVATRSNFCGVIESGEKRYHRFSRLTKSEYQKLSRIRTYDLS